MKRLSIWLAALAGLVFSQLGLANQSIEPWVSCDGLAWESIDANINVHRDSGEYLDTVAGDSGAWVAPESGAYFLVVVNGTDWRDWTRTASLFYERNEETRGGCVDPNLFTQNTRFSVLSETEIEFTWELDTRYLDRYAHVEVMRFNDSTGESDTFLATGDRYYADDLSPDDSYTFALVTYDIYGVAGDSVQIFDGINTREILNENNMKTALPPLGLRVEVYSNSALEIFWENNIDFVSGETSYSLWLDHVLLDKYNYGGSRFVQFLEPGRTYELRVIANRDNYEASEAAFIVATAFGNGGGNQSSNISVNDGTISWSDSGWYQVQDAQTFESLCEGGSSCSVPPGMYIVINHHTGIRETVRVD